MWCFIYNSYRLHFGPNWILTLFLKPSIKLSIIWDVCPGPDQHPSRLTSPRSDFQTHTAELPSSLLQPWAVSSPWASQARNGLCMGCVTGLSYMPFPVQIISPPAPSVLKKGLLHLLSSMSFILTCLIVLWDLIDPSLWSFLFHHLDMTSTFWHYVFTNSLL